MQNGIPSRDVIRRVLCALRPEVEERLNNDFSGIRHQELDESPTKRVRGREESRISMQFEVPSDFPNRSQWAGLRTIGLVVYSVTQGDKEQTDIRHSLSSLPLDVGVFARCVRNPQGVESTCHWSLVMKRKSCGWSGKFFLAVPGLKGTLCALALSRKPARPLICLFRRSKRNTFRLSSACGKIVLCC